MSEFILFDDIEVAVRLADDLRRIQMGQAPTVRQLADAPTLCRWHVHWMHVPCLIGIGVGHPIVPDGPMRTSRLVAIDQEGRQARTASRWYSLSPKNRENFDG
jgi:hypothetical protein